MVVSVGVRVSWILPRSGSVLLVDLTMLLAVERQKYGRIAYHMSLAPRVPVVAGLRHDVGDFHVVDQVVWALKD